MMLRVIAQKAARAVPGMPVRSMAQAVKRFYKNVDTAEDAQVRLPLSLVVLPA